MKIGDVVYLNSNPEQTMTVAFVLGEDDADSNTKYTQQTMRIHGYADGDVQCKWPNGSETKAEFFKAAMLTKK